MPVTGDQTLPAVQNTPAENITAAQPLEPPPYPGEQEADQSGVTLAQIRQEVIRRLVEGNENLSFPPPEVGTTSREDMPAMVTAHSSTLDETNELDFPKDETDVTLVTISGDEEETEGDGEREKTKGARGAQL